MVKIGVIHPVMDVIGGAEITTLYLLDALKKSNHQVTLYTTTKKLPDVIDCKIKHTWKMKFPIFWRIQRMLESERLLKLAKDEDVIIVMSGGFVMGKFYTKTILYCHSFFDSESKFVNSKKNASFLPRKYNNMLKKKIIEQFEQLKKDNVQLVSNSEYTASKIKQNFLKDSKIIYPPTKLEEFINYDNKNNREGVVTVSRYSPEKNLSFALEVIKNSPQLSYKIIGNAKFTSQIDIYHQLMDNCREKRNIKLFCNIKRESVMNNLKTSKIYFHTSKETFGISVIESIAAGCIPIVPDNSAHKETVPFKELRYETNNANDAHKLIMSADRGEFDKYIPRLQEHIIKFDVYVFQNKMMQLINEQT